MQEDANDELGTSVLRAERDFSPISSGDDEGRIIWVGCRTWTSCPSFVNLSRGVLWMGSALRPCVAVPCAHCRGHCSVDRKYMLLSVPRDFCPSPDSFTYTEIFDRVLAWGRLETGELVSQLLQETGWEAGVADRALLEVIVASTIV